MRVAPRITLTEPERRALRQLAATNAGGAPARIAQRASIILRAADGAQNKEIAQEFSIGRAQAARWRERYLQAGIEGILRDLPREEAQGALPKETGADGPAGHDTAPLLPAGPASDTPEPDLALAPPPAAVLPPRGQRQLRRRDALMARLLEARRQRCTLVQGQAGSGKTSTLVAWRKELVGLGWDACWFSLSSEDDEPARFIDGLQASIAQADPMAVREASQVVVADWDESAIELWVVTLVQALARRDRELVLMLDDLHHITDLRILQGIQWLLDYAPGKVHLAISSRSAVELALERLRLQGQLAEFDMRDLRFSLEESEHFLREQLGEIEPREAARLHGLTDGWVAGLQLLVMDMRQGGAPTAATAVKDARAFARYFDREVLTRLASDDLDMMERIAVCRRVCPSLAAELLGRSEPVARIHARLLALEADNQFIVANGERDAQPWFRLHPLLRETLLARLATRPADDVRSLHARAWQWFERGGETDEAVFHAVEAGNPDAAATLVEACAYTLLVAGELNRVAALVRRLPADTVAARFGLQVVRAYVQLYARDFDALEATLSLLESKSAPDRPIDRYTLCLLRAGQALQLDDVDRTAQLLPALLDIPDEADVFTWHVRGNVLAWLLTLRGEFDRARAILEEAGSLGLRLRSLLVGRCIQGISLMREGRIAQSGKIVLEVMEEADRQGAGAVGLACMAAGLLADTLYESGEPEAACRLLEPRIALLERVSLPETVLRAGITLSNAHWIAGRQDQALRTLERLQGYARRYGLDRIRARALALQLRRCLQQGRMARTSAILEELEALAGRLAGRRPQTAREVGQTLVDARIDMALQARDHTAAVALIAQRLADCELPPVAAGLHLQQAIALQGLGSREAAARACLVAVRLGHRHGLVRTLLDPLEAAAPGNSPLQDFTPEDKVLAFYVQRLRAIAAGGPAAGPVSGAPAWNKTMSALSEREREILALVAQTMSNKKIASALNVSAETVKWHLKNIYAKLGVWGRGGAAARLRDLAQGQASSAPHATP